MQVHFLFYNILDRINILHVAAVCYLFRERIHALPSRSSQIDSHNQYSTVRERHWVLRVHNLLSSVKRLRKDSLELVMSE